MIEALLSPSSATLLACDSWRSSSRAILGCKEIKETEDSNGGIGTSLMDVKRDAVVGNEVAYELIIARSSGVVKDVEGKSVVLGWKRSECAASVHI